VQRANAVLSECIRDAEPATIDDAAHFMIATHPDTVGRLIARHVNSAEAGLRIGPMRFESDRLLAMTA
jgi:hypothetical protein